MFLGKLCGQQPRREWRRVDRYPQARPQLGERAEMVLVCMGEQDADQIRAFGLDEGDVRQDQVDAGEMLLGRKADATVHHQPFATA